MNSNFNKTMNSSAALSPSSMSGHTNVVNISTISSPTTTMTYNNSRPLKLRRSNHNDELVCGLSKLLRSESMTDVTLICKGGQTIRAHRVVLSTFSPYFRSIFEAQPFVSNPCQYPVIVIKDLELSELRTIVDFIYRGDVSVSREKLPLLLQAARALEVNGLLTSLVSTGLHDTSSAAVVDRPLQISVTTANSSKRNSPTTIEMDLNGTKKPKVEMSSNDLIMLNIGSNSSGSSLLQSQQSSMDEIKRQQLQSQQQLTQIVESLRKRTNSGLTIQQQRQQFQRNQIQNRIQLNQLKKQMYDLNQSVLNPMSGTATNTSSIIQLPTQLLANNSAARKGGPRVSQLQSAQLVQFQQRLRQQMQDKQRQIELNKAAAAFLAAGGGSYVPSGRESPSSSPTNPSNNIAEPEIQLDEEDDHETTSPLTALHSDEIGTESTEERPPSQLNSIKDCCDVVETQLVIDDENNNNIDPTDANCTSTDLNDNESSSDKNIEQSSAKDGQLSDNTDPDVGETEQPCEMVVQTHLLPPGDEEEDDDELYEMDIDKDAIFQRQQQVRLEQLQKQQHFKEQFQLLHVSEAEQRMFELQEQLQHVASTVPGNTIQGFNLGASHSASNAALSAAAVELLESLGLNGNGIGAGRRGLLGSTGNVGGKDSAAQNSIASGSEDTDNDANTLDTLQDSFYDEYSSLSDKSPIPGKLEAQVSTVVTKTPDFLLPRGPGRPRKGNKSNDVSPCPECKKKFVRPDVLKLHFKSVHLNERHPCSMCPKIFKWPGDLSKHKRTKHPEAFPPANSTNRLNNMLTIK